MKNYGMTKEEIMDRVDRLGDILECTNPMDKLWKETYDEYFILNGILDEIYREENQDKFDEFVNKYIRGKKYEEIDPDDFQYYSDWHKDMYGFRPKSIPV